MWERRWRRPHLRCGHGKAPAQACLYWMLPASLALFGIPLLWLLYPGHTGLIRTITYSPDGALLFTGSDDGQIKIIEASQANLLATLVEHSSFVLSVACSPDGGRLLSSYALCAFSSFGQSLRSRVSLYQIE
eukprot:m.187883 g.187883  ORF g.187883 m.187883 type:complete len:132 (-) comp53585_c0_seq9:220-615(-)